MKNLVLALMMIVWVGGETLGIQQGSAGSSDSHIQTSWDSEKTPDNQTSASGKRLVHLVWFKLKPDTDRADFIQQLKKLDQIEPVCDFEVGQFADLKDPRAMSDYQVAIQMGFKSEEDYQTYQAHRIHLDLKSKIGDYVAGPPVTYDYWSQ